MLMDELDQKIIAELTINARVSIPKLAKILGVARGTIQTRMDRLISSGVIKGFTVLLHNRAHENMIRAFTLIELGNRNIRNTINSIKLIPGIISVSNTNGKWDLIVEIATSELSDLNSVIAYIRQLDGVMKSESFILLGSA